VRCISTKQKTKNQKIQKDIGLGSLMSPYYKKAAISAKIKITKMQKSNKNAAKPFFLNQDI